MPTFDEEYSCVLPAVQASSRNEELAGLLRCALFRLNTRRFGAVAELLVKRMTAFEGPQSVFHDLYDSAGAQRVEVKFSTVLTRWHTPLRAETLEAVLREAISEVRAVSFADWGSSAFDCNIQQVKPAEFELLYYGLFFSDRATVFKCLSQCVPTMPGWSDKQHKGNKGEGQFHVTNKNLPYHLDRHLVLHLSYQELAALLFPPGLEMNAFD